MDAAIEFPVPTVKVILHRAGQVEPQWRRKFALRVTIWAKIIGVMLLYCRSLRLKQF